MNPGAVQTLLIGSWIALVACCIVLPYVFGVPPRTPRERAYIAAAIAFITWLLAGFVFLRST